MTHTALSYNNVLNFNPYLNIRYFIFQINYMDYHKIHLNDKQWITLRRLIHISDGSNGLFSMQNSINIKNVLHYGLVK